VTSPALPTLVDLLDLRLEAARTLLSQAGQVTLPSLQAGATAYLQAVIDGLNELSLTDPLTGLANRRQLEHVLAAEIDRVARSGEAALLLMLDIDHFKAVNDTYGHLAGDQVLQSVAHALAGCIRPMDTAARYGGEEFAVVLPSCQPAFGRAVAERIRRTIESTPIRVSPTVDLRITVSIGGAFALQWIRSTTDLWIDRADQQLYIAKTHGRNRLCLEEQPDSTVSAEEKHLLFGHLAVSDPAWIDMRPAVGSDKAP
jgi:two-component system cell cycle response regulator